MRDPVQRPGVSTSNAVHPRFEASALLGRARPRSEASRTGVASQLPPQALARPGVYGTSDGGLVITHHVRNQARERPMEKAVWHVEVAPTIDLLVLKALVFFHCLTIQVMTCQAMTNN